MRASVSIRGADDNGDSEGPPHAVRGMDVLDAAYHTAQSFPGGISGLAVRMGKTPSVLMNKLNSNVDSHHLTLREAQTIMDVTDDDAILQAMADHRGYDLVRTISANTDQAESLFWQAAAAMAEFQEAVADAMQNGVTRNSVRRASNRAADAMAHMHNLIGALRAKLPSQPPEAK